MFSGPNPHISSGHLPPPSATPKPEKPALFNWSAPDKDTATTVACVAAGALVASRVPGAGRAILQTVKSTPIVNRLTPTVARVVGNKSALYLAGIAVNTVTCGVALSSCENLGFKSSQASHNDIVELYKKTLSYELEYNAERVENALSISEMHCLGSLKETKDQLNLMIDTAVISEEDREAFKEALETISSGSLSSYYTNMLEHHERIRRIKDIALRELKPSHLLPKQITLVPERYSDADSIARELSSCLIGGVVCLAAARFPLFKSVVRPGAITMIPRALVKKIGMLATLALGGIATSTARSVLSDDATAYDLDLLAHSHQSGRGGVTYLDRSEHTMDLHVGDELSEHLQNTLAIALTGLMGDCKSTVTGAACGAIFKDAISHSISREEAEEKLQKMIIQPSLERIRTNADGSVKVLKSTEAELDLHLAKLKQQFSERLEKAQTKHLKSLHKGAS